MPTLAGRGLIFALTSEKFVFQREDIKRENGLRRNQRDEEMMTEDAASDLGTGDEFLNEGCIIPLESLVYRL